jgi:hypothetical protein
MLGAAAGVVAGAVSVAAVSSASDKRYGRVTKELAIVRGWLPGRVTLNGVDISSYCLECDDIVGTAKVYVRDHDGAYHIDPETHSIATATLHGRVVFTPGPIGGVR